MVKAEAVEAITLLSLAKLSIVFPLLASMICAAFFSFLNFGSTKADASSTLIRPSAYFAVNLTTAYPLFILNLLTSPSLVSSLKAHCTMARWAESPGKFSSISLILFTGLTTKLLSLAATAKSLSELVSISNLVASVNKVLIVSSEGSISLAKVAILTISCLSSILTTWKPKSVSTKPMVPTGLLNVKSLNGATITPS